MSLVLTRRRGERIFMGDHITIEVGDVERGKVKLLITAPEDLRVYREEVYLRLRKERENG